MCGIDRRWQRSVRTIFLCYDWLMCGPVRVSIREIWFLNMPRGGLFERCHIAAMISVYKCMYWFPQPAVELCLTNNTRGGETKPPSSAFY